jgi:uncharacterized protein YggL (DUF469 family)
MKKRLRKKLMLAEFQQIGFPVRLKLSLPDDDPEGHQFYSRMEAAVEALGLLLLGTVDDLFVFTNYNILPRPTATEPMRHMLIDWLRQQAEILVYRVGPLDNVWRALTS